MTVNDIRTPAKFFHCFQYAACVEKMLSYYEQTIETFLLVTLPDIISGYFGHDTGETEK